MRSQSQPNRERAKCNRADLDIELKRQTHRGISVRATIAAVDFDALATLDEALRGADRLFLAPGTSPRQVANEIALIDAAVAAGVGQLVKLSTMGPPSRLHPMDWHMQIEAHLATVDIG